MLTIDTSLTHESKCGTGRDNRLIIRPYTGLILLEYTVNAPIYIYIHSKIRWVTFRKDPIISEKGRAQMIKKKKIFEKDASKNSRAFCKWSGKKFSVIRKNLTHILENPARII